jgi:hypothetical protein
LLTVLAVLGPACANRGMSRAGDDGGAAGAGGTGPGDAGSGGAGLGGMGSGGAIDMAPPPIDASDSGGNRDATDARDASADHSCTPAADFTYETTTTSEHVTPLTPDNAVKSIAHSTTAHYCGLRSLELTTLFAPGNTKGEVLIDMPDTLQNVAGKTVTIHVSASPAPDVQSYVAVTLITASGYLTLMPTIRGLSTDWLTQDYMIPADSDAGVMKVTGISIQVFDLKSYSGKIYIDDLAIR